MLEGALGRGHAVLCSHRMVNTHRYYDCRSLGIAQLRSDAGMMTRRNQWHALKCGRNCVQGRRKASESGGISMQSGGVAVAAAQAAAAAKAAQPVEDFYRFQQREKRRSGALSRLHGYPWEWA